VAVRGIYLVGFSGTGKSTVARLVAERLGWQAYDLDQLVAERAGMEIPEIFAREGEPAFRDRESQALRDLPCDRGFVVATGGGAPLREENRRVMAERGWVVALEARAELLHGRIEAQRQALAPDAVRPLLGTGDALERIRGLKQARQPVYALADWTVHTDRLTPEQVADEVARARQVLEAARRG
jgi:shikimate kinase